MNKTLYCSISAHGYGHIGQSVPVLQRLHQLRPDIDIVIQCDVPQAWLRQRLCIPFEHVRANTDFGMLMRDAFTIDVEATHQRYCVLHNRWREQVAAAAQLIQPYQPALVYSNVAYLSNAAAASLSIPVVNLCSLSWYHIYHSYCADLTGAQQVLDDMLQAYNSAELFLAPQPSLPMPEFNHLQVIGTIARNGRNRADRIRQLYNLPAATKLVLVSYGGVDMPLDFVSWPRHEDVCYLVGDQECPARSDFIAYESLPMSYLDVFCSADAVVSKPGYGTNAEAACNGKSLIYTRRPDWPEDPYLVQWSQQHVHCIELSRHDLYRGQIHESIQQLETIARPARVEPLGIEQAVTSLLHYLSPA